jgi:glycosyltransferase involved in cell wall biosynthesis
LRIALDATYSLGRNLSGVGVYSREILFGLARAHPDERFLYCYRPHRLWKSVADSLPPNASRRWLRASENPAPGADLFHALNQRVDARARRTVCTFHDLFALTGEYSSPEFRARFADQARRAAQNSDAIIAVSQFTAAHVQELLGVEASRIHVIPHGVRISPEARPLLNPARRDGAVRVPIPNRESHRAGDGFPLESVVREQIVLFVGAIQRRKNIARLVQAFESMPAGWRLTLAGATDGYEAATELGAIEESPRKSDIDVLGYVGTAVLESLYSRAGIFAFPSLDEGFGIPVLEAMAHGIPVITSNRSALPEAAGDAAILVDPTNVDQLAAELNRLASEESLRADLARRGRDRARQFPWETAVEKTWAVYQSLLAGAR